MGTITPIFKTVSPLDKLKQSKNLPGINAAYHIDVQNGLLPKNDTVKNAYTVLMHYLSNAYQSNDVTAIRHAPSNKSLSSAIILNKHGQSHVDHYYIHGIDSPENCIDQVIAASMVAEPIRLLPEQRDLAQEALGKTVVDYIDGYYRVKNSRMHKLSALDPVLQALYLANGIAERETFLEKCDKHTPTDLSARTSHNADGMILYAQGLQEWISSNEGNQTELEKLFIETNKKVLFATKDMAGCETTPTPAWTPRLV